MATFRRLIQPGLDAVVANWRPFLLIQTCAAIVLIAYYTLAPVREFGETLAEFKRNGGIPFAAISVVFAAVFLPELARRITKTPRDKPFTWGDFGFQAAYFAFLGVLLDWFYSLLATVFGDTPAPGIVATKIAVDLIFLTAVFNMPLVTALFAWRDAGFEIKGARALLANGGFWQRYVPLLIGAWAFWLPVLVCLYSLPGSLQFVFSVLAEAAWCLLLVHLASKRPATTP